LRIWSKIRAILGWSRFVNLYVERDKDFSKNFIFAFDPLRILLHSSAARAKHLLCSSVPKAQGISPNESGLFLIDF